MSRMTTPSTTQPASPTKVPHDKVAMRAYEKWVKKGRPQGTSVQDWLEAEDELKIELTKGPQGQPQHGQPQHAQRR